MTTTTSETIIEDGVLREYRGRGDAVVLPAGLSSIGAYAFDGCTGITSVTLPAGPTHIGYYVFRGCAGLREIVTPPGWLYVLDPRRCGAHNLDDPRILSIGCEEHPIAEWPALFERIADKHDLSPAERLAYRQIVRRFEVFKSKEKI